MTNVWQAVQGDYRPADVFEQGDVVVIARNIKLTEENIYQWEECRLPIDDFLDIVSIVDSQMSDGLFDVADLADENSSAIDDLAEYVSEIDERVKALEEKEN